MCATRRAIDDDENQHGPERRNNRSSWTRPHQTDQKGRKRPNAGAAFLADAMSSRPPKPKFAPPAEKCEPAALLAGRALEAQLLNRFGLPEQVAEFNRFEELSKLYEIERPFVARTQVEFLFDVYDGRRLQLAQLEEEDEELEDGYNSGDQERAERRLEKRDQRNGIAAEFEQPTGSGQSWCRRVFARRRRRDNLLKCCLQPSETSADLGLMSTSTSGQSVAIGQGHWQSSNPIHSLIEAALELGQANERPEERELKLEALNVVSSALAAAANSVGRPLDQLLIESGPNQALVLESAQLESTGGSVSVCLLDKRRLGALMESSTTTTGAAINGRRWARASSQMVHLRRKLRNSSLRLARRRLGPALKHEHKNHLLDQLARKASRRFWAQLARDKLANWTPANDDDDQLKVFFANRRWNKHQKSRPVGKKIDPEQVIDLVKGSLNQLIDAQLLLRNKLAGPELFQAAGGAGGGGANSSLPSAIQRIRSADYEQLLRNNFNLLKIWQNLEETKEGLVCFVCEPIKANLADLFWFDGRRTEWPQAQAFDAAGLNSSAGQYSGSDHSPLLASPLVSLDMSQVKRGFLQILEALNFLHTICRLIHRNLTPRNILICHGDNWKLSGLELAVRFESTLISESASMMAHDFAQATRLPTGSFLHTSHQLASNSSSPSSSGAPLRRQHTLHQTKCQAYAKATGASGGGLLEPELDYVAPEILREAKCSHKSDLFSFGLILGQTFDLNRHKQPLNCLEQLENYEPELKKLGERRKWKLARLVPLEMRSALIEMLDCEPNGRPSASALLQIFKRPLELCATSEDSLRHLKSSLDHLDTRFEPGGRPNQQADGANQQQNKLKRAAHSAGSYFRRLTSGRANQTPKRRQTEMIQLLGYLVRALDATALVQCQQQELERRPSFGSTRLQFEQTLELLRQLLRPGWSWPQADSEQIGAVRNKLPKQSAPVARLPVDSRTLLLVVALHRRLLDQVGQLRRELPPMCRLIAPSSTSSSQPLDRTLTSSSHRALADLEERLSLTISQHSIGRLVERLSDPLLKLEEFLLVFELVNDLLGFVGQKWKQSFCLRGKQLLNELTPVTGCPSLSSSEEEDEEAEGFADQTNADQLWTANEQDELEAANADGQIGFLSQQQQLNQVHHHTQFSGSALALATMQGGGQSGSASPVKRLSQQSHRSAGGLADCQLERPRNRQLYNLPTSINVTAPSPMGSSRDVSRSSQGEPTQLFSTIGNSQAKGQHGKQDSENQLAERTSQISLCELSGRRSIAGVGCTSQQTTSTTRLARHCDSSDNLLMMMNAKNATPHHNLRQRQHQDEPNPPQDDESRSKLIDELLKTINDDSFNEFIDFNNKLAAVAGSGSSSQPDQMNANQPGDQLHSNRPKSALAGDGAARPPRSLNVSPAGGTTTNATATSSNKSSGGGSQRTAPRSSVCATSSSNQSSTFDNVIRRMSTNFVQNFNKIGGSTLGAAGETAHPSNSSDLMAGLRREKSSNATYSNSLYVDTQIPARRHSDNTINVPRIQVALSSPSSSSSRTNLNQRASVSASKLATKWKLTAKTNQREASDKLSPNLGGALGYIRRHSSGNTQGGGGSNNNDQTQSNGLGAQLLNASPFKTRSNSNLGIDFLMSNRSMKRRYSAASMLGHQTQRKAEDLIDAGMKSVQNMFN